MEKIERIYLGIKSPETLQGLDAFMDGLNKGVGVGIEKRVVKRDYVECLATMGEAHIDTITETVFGGIKKGGKDWRAAKARVTSWLTSNDCRTKVKGIVEKVSGKPAVWKLSKSAAEAEASRKAKMETIPVPPVLNAPVDAGKTAAAKA